MNRRADAASEWRGYFVEFVAEHGGEPFEWKGQLLFRDGWRYSNGDYRGPAVPPVSDHERRELSAVYWKLRRVSIMREQRRLSVRLGNLDGAEELNRLLQLPVSVSRKIEAIEDRLDDLRHWEAECERELERLEHEDQSIAETDDDRRAMPRLPEAPADSKFR